MKFDKLVRDRIPEIIAKDGRKARTHVAGKEEFEKRLGEKLKEEAIEFYVSGKEEELADLLEVIHAICKSKGITMEELEMIRAEKARERGSFENRIVLDGVD